MRLFLFYIVFSLFLPAVGFAQENKTVVLACNEFPPQKMENSADGNKGIDVDILEAVFQDMNMDLQVRFYPWKRALQLAQNGSVDGLCSCSYTKEREQHFHYSQKLGDVGIGLFHKTDRRPDSILAQNTQVGVIQGYALSRDLDDKEVDKVDFNDDVLALKVLNVRRIDGFYSYRDTGLYILKNNPMLKSIGFKQYRSSDYYSCFSKASFSDVNFVDRFNESLTKLKTNGGYNEILQQYR